MIRQLKISVVVPAYQSQDKIDRCLRALARQTVPRDAYEVIVVDDGSHDETCTRVKRFAGVRLITQRHAGPAAARNLGVEHARGEVVLFTDADCEPAPDWIERMVAPFDDPDIVGVKGAYLTQQEQLVARFVQAEYEDKYDRMLRETQIDFIDTYSAGYQRKVFLARGGFDTVFPGASVEDQEFSFRLARRGYRMVFAPEARVYHWGHARTLRAYCLRKFRIGYWKVLVHRRHPDKLLRDSHTPQVLKLQMLLVALGGFGLLAAPIWQPAWWSVGLAGLLFLLTTVPFVMEMWGKFPLLALLSPGMLFVRALALGAGFATGLLATLILKYHPKGGKGVQGAPYSRESFGPGESSLYD